MRKALGITRTTLAVGAALALLGYELGRWAYSEYRWHQDALSAWHEFRAEQGR